MAANVEGAETFVGFEAGEAEKALVEMHRPCDIFDVNASFEHAGDAWPRHLKSLLRPGARG